ncbi:MAG TPA: mechanosensitive ion channel domain-containing protein, partial [Pyrinomonadaceae bacterium]|nr:mechanosensitive ion channel domain-containing protein [Pyrinomonadaceae bacterium]
MIRSGSNNRRILFVVTAAIVLLLLYRVVSFDTQIHQLLAARMGGLAARAVTVVNVIRLVLLGILTYLFVRVLNSLIFGLIYRMRSGYEAPTLVRNIFSIVAFTALFLLIFSAIFEGVNLGALFTTSAIFGVILGLALQDTLGNFFAGISLQADRPFQIGDVITVGAQRHSGVVEEITWRAVKIRTFSNHVVLISNSTAAREPIEVCPRDNLNARH